MPEVKWVAPTELHDHDGKYLTRPPVVRIPVLTLDAIEAWLKGEMDDCRKGGCYGMALLTSLLAQVRAWKASVQ